MSCPVVTRVTVQQVVVRTGGQRVSIRIRRDAVRLRVESSNVVIRVRRNPIVLRTSPQGPPGPQGPAGTPVLVVDATCSVSETVGDLVYVDSVSLGVPDVRKADVDDDAKMPAMGIITEKPTATTAKIQVAGNVTLSSLTPGPYFVGTDAKLTTSPPGNPLAGKRAIQVMGHAYSDTEFLVLPTLNPTRILPS